MKYELFAADELPPGEMRAAKLGGVAIVVLRLPDGTFRALRDRCPHAGAQLSHGLLQRMVDGDDVGERWLSERMILRCPWHGFEFDVDDGRCPADPVGNRVATYPVTVEGDTVVVER
jgi:nitrite reductase (NADH) small subunit